MARDLDPRPRRLNLAVLVVGTTAAIVCAVGPLWLVRVGVGVALLTALASVWLMWRQMKRLVAAHLGEVQALREQHNRELHQVNAAHHAETMAMIERFTARKAAHAAEIAAAQAEIAALRASLASSELDNEAKQTRISALNKRIADLEAEASAVDAQVMDLPRRGLGARTLDLSTLPLVYPIDERKHA